MAKRTHKARDVARPAGGAYLRARGRWVAARAPRAYQVEAGRLYEAVNGRLWKLDAELGIWTVLEIPVGSGVRLYRYRLRRPHRKNQKPQVQWEVLIES